MTPEQAAAIAKLQQHHDAICGAVAASGERMVQHGERAVVVERNPRARRALVKAVRKVRRAIGKPRPTATVHPVPTGNARTTRADAPTLQPIAARAP